MTEMESQQLVLDYIMDYSYLMMLPMVIDKDGKKVFATEEEKNKEAFKYLKKEYGNR